METITINVPLIIPQILIDQGAIEVYAAKFANWTPTITQNIVDGNGFITGSEAVPNPQSAQDAAISYLQSFVKEQYRVITVESAAQQGRDKALAEFNSLFPQA